ncbi:hypothetical protein Agabi119p4_7031 [Agaricus bisporus var. burnettii]|uniref:Uncharacterized protein n=1 Tax=Agaricus bisporus var. burnettii TaxID=192524 RepID=A0A8H7F0N7_AGABI|nr:hypothetical protein Agabi119p4_7031 [Agaricus bisporus var. burnettii]
MQDTDRTHRGNGSSSAQPGIPSSTTHGSSMQPLVWSYRFSRLTSEIRHIIDTDIYVALVDEKQNSSIRYIITTTRDIKGDLYTSLYNCLSGHPGSKEIFARISWASESPTIDYLEGGWPVSQSTVFPALYDPNANNRFLGYGGFLDFNFIWFPAQEPGGWNLHYRHENGGLAPGKQIGRLYNEAPGHTVFTFFPDPTIWKPTSVVVISWIYFVAIIDVDDLLERLG